MRTSTANSIKQPGFAQSAARIFNANDRMNQLLIEHLDPVAWTVKPPGKARTHALHAATGT